MSLKLIVFSKTYGSDSWGVSIVWAGFTTCGALLHCNVKHEGLHVITWGWSLHNPVITL